MKNTRNHSLRYLRAVLVLVFALSLPMAARADLITLKLPGIMGDVTAVGQEILSRFCPLREMYRNPQREAPVLEVEEACRFLAT
jgi:hypothetical protein